MSSSPSEPCLQTSSVPITQNEEQAAQQKDDSSYVLCQYDSSENEEEKALKTEHRSWIMMWTFPTPRSYLKTYEERKKKNELIPRDISREELEKNFLDALNKCQLMGKLRQMIVVYEPHKKLMPDGSAHEMHYHVCFKMSANFAHKGVSNTLAQHYGLHGHMSYPRKGWYQMAKYVLTDSAVKLPVHLDPTPLFWPTRMTKEDMLKKMQLTEEDYLKKRAEENRMQWKEESNNGDGTHQDRWRKRRRVLDFSEFSDYVLHHKITNEQEFWVLACKEKEAGNPTLWNYGGTAAVAKQIQKCNKAHMAQFRDDVFLGTSKATSKYPLSAFNIPDTIRVWMEHFKGEMALIIQGEGGLGKTEMAKAILASMGKYFFVDSLDTVKSLLFTGKESILFDDVTLQNFSVDEVKSFLDVKSERAVKCRHEDGFIPADTVRIFLTNHERHTFFPRETDNKDHSRAINRRMIWVTVTEKLFTESDGKTQKDKEKEVGVECESEIPVMDDLETLKTKQSRTAKEPSLKSPFDEEYEPLLEEYDMFDGDEEAAMWMNLSSEDACRESPASSKGLPLLSSGKTSPSANKELEAKMMIEKETKRPGKDETAHLGKDTVSTENHEHDRPEPKKNINRVKCIAENSFRPLVRYRRKSKPNPPWHHYEHRRRDVRWGTSQKSWWPWQS